jgi:hypothetical protein
MTEDITTAPKDGTKILCICSDGKTRYCWWFGCSDVDGCWMTEEVAEPVAWYRTRRLPPSLKEQALKALKYAPGPDYPNPITLLTADEHALIRRALESLPN